MIRTNDELIRKVSEDLIWRKKELSEMKGLVHGERGLIRSKVLIRAAVALLYAHWEGFVKKSSAYYLEYVSSKRLKFKDLAPNFVALSIKAKFAELGASKKISGANNLADFFCNSLDKQSNVPHKNAIETKSNLSSEVLEDIISTLGISRSPFATKLNYIDSNLVSPRNHIAHGESLEVEIEDYYTLHDEVIALLEAFKNEIENSSTLTLYKR